MACPPSISNEAEGDEERRDSSPSTGEPSREEDELGPSPPPLSTAVSGSLGSVLTDTSVSSTVGGSSESSSGTEAGAEAEAEVGYWVGAGEGVGAGSEANDTDVLSADSND